MGVSGNHSVGAASRYGSHVIVYLAVVVVEAVIFEYFVSQLLYGAVSLKISSAGMGLNSLNVKGAEYYSPSFTYNAVYSVLF